MDADQVLAGLDSFIASGEVPGGVVGVLSEGALSLAAAGRTEAGGDGADLDADCLMRISSNTKPVVAALTLALAQDGLLTLDDPVERFVPELAGRRVLRRLDGRIDETMPASRPVTVDDLLTMRLGFGFVFESACPALVTAAQAGLGIGPPDPSINLTPDEWIAKFADFPLLDQPGTAWRYDVSYAVLGVVLARAAGLPLYELLRDRLLDPLEMSSTSFVAPPGRLPPCYTASEDGLVVFDPPDGRWTRTPKFPDARGGLVSTATDLLRFAGALLAGGSDVISTSAITAMTTDWLTPEQREAPSAQAFLDGAGWGYGVQVAEPGRHPNVRTARYGWGGGLGTLWYSWPGRQTAAVLLTQVLPPSPRLVNAFIEAVETSL